MAHVHHSVGRCHVCRRNIWASPFPGPAAATTPLAATFCAAFDAERVGAMAADKPVARQGVQAKKTIVPGSNETKCINNSLVGFIENNN